MVESIQHIIGKLKAGRSSQKIVSLNSYQRKDWVFLMRSIFRTSKKGSIITFLLIVGSLFLAPIILYHVIDPFQYRSERISPSDYPDSVWQCYEPSIDLHVEKSKVINGVIEVNGEKCKVICSFDWGRFFLMTKAVSEVGKDDILLEGVADCTDEEIIISVRKDYVFGGEYSTIVLKRTA